MIGLERRLVALERAPVAFGLVVRVYATYADADADSEPLELGRRVLAVITGVPRCPDGAAL